MDPHANIREQRDLSRRLLNEDNYLNEDGEINAEHLLDDAQRLAELVEALQGWIKANGYPPAPESIGAFVESDLFPF